MSFRSPPANNLRVLSSAGILILGAALLTLLNIILRFPGELNPDSLSQYQQALSGHYNDWHPPVMARLWSLFLLVEDGTWTMFVFHTVCYWTALLLCGLALNALGRSVLAWACLAIGLFPPFLMLSINIHKDVGLAVTLLLGFAITLLARVTRCESIATRMLATTLLGYALLVRANGSFAVIPILCYVWCPKYLARPIAVALATAALTVPLQPVQSFINHDLLKASPAGALRSLMVFDLAGIAHFAGDDRIAGEADAQSSRFAPCYSPVIADPLYKGARCGFVWDDLTGATGSADWGDDHGLQRRWIAAIATHPGAYLQHRARHLNAELTLLTPPHLNDVAVVRRIVNGTADASLTPWHGWLLGVMRDNVFSAPAFWLAAAFATLLAVLPFERPQSLETDRAAVALALSAAIYTLGYAIIGVATDPRYQFPAMLSAFVAAGIAAPTLRGRLRYPRARDICAGGILVAVGSAVAAARLILPDARWIAP